MQWHLLQASNVVLPTLHGKGELQLNGFWKTGPIMFVTKVLSIGFGDFSDL